MNSNAPEEEDEEDVKSGGGVFIDAAWVFFVKVDRMPLDLWFNVYFQLAFIEKSLFTHLNTILKIVVLVKTLFVV